MFRKLREDILKLNANINDATHNEKAKKLKKKLLKIGIPLVIIGAIGIIICVVFIIIQEKAEFSSFKSMRPSNPDFEQNFYSHFDSSFDFIPLAIFGIFLFAFALFIGVSIILTALEITIGGAVSKFVDSSINLRCPKCGDTVEENEHFCNKCGAQLIFECPSCKTKYTIEDKYCKSCGYRLK